ncbi:MAG: hypothetical protein Q8P39_00190 [Candidatus Yanofskybacteria bacterium]|nr:hypothetical protein [Candidatus Yanofskybacteria bacterium]
MKKLFVSVVIATLVAATMIGRVPPVDTRDGSVNFSYYLIEVKRGETEGEILVSMPPGVHISGSAGFSSVAAGLAILPIKADTGVLWLHAPKGMEFQPGVFPSTTQYAMQQLR